jgi:hypothetical protein
MNDEKEPDREPANAAPNTSESLEVPREKPPGAWEMPKPVFKQSTGYLPQGFQDRFPNVDAEVAGNVRAAADPAPVSAPLPPPIEISESPDIQPQPDLTEDFTVDQTVTPPTAAKKKRSPAAQIIMVLLGILAMAVVAVGFLALVYYLFFYHPSESQILN